MGIQRLPRAVSATIVSTSSVQSQVSILKELVENAIDAIDEDNANGQIYIEIDKDSAGLDYMSVKDNGSGVLKFDRNMMCLNCTTSKLKTVDDLSNGVPTCGFRGEALHFIARLVKTMHITTKTKADLTMQTWSVNNSGLPNSGTRSSPGVNGTTIKLTGLFKSIPVRYKFLKEKNKNKMHKAIENMVIEYTMVYRNIRFQLRYVKAMTNGKIVNGDCKSYPNKISESQLIYNILGTRKKDWLFESKFGLEVMDIHTRETFTIKVAVVLPIMRIEDIPTTKYNMKILAVNKRPLDLTLKFGRSISSKINECYQDSALLTPSIWYVSVSIPLNKVDVNIEPGKSDVIVCNEESMLGSFKKTLSEIVRKEHGIEERYEKVPEDDNEIGLLVHEIEKEMEDGDYGIEPITEVVEATNVEKDHKESTNDHIDLVEPSIDDFTLVNTEIFTAHDNILGSSDNSFLEEFDTTLKNIKNKSTTKPVDESVPREIKTRNIPESSVPASRDENEWSHTVYDSTGISPELDAIEPAPALRKEVIKTVNPAQIINPNAEEEIQDIEEVAPLTVVISETISEKPVLSSTSASKINSGFQTAPQQRPKKPNTSKQMDMTSYLTYHMSPEKKKSTQSESKLPKITDSTQNTYGDVLQVEFEFSLDSRKRQRQLIDDERWVKRTGIPSTNLISTALKLYKSISHKIADETPPQNEYGIYSLK